MDIHLIELAIEALENSKRNTSKEKTLQRELQEAKEEISRLKSLLEQPRIPKSLLEKLKSQERTISEQQETIENLEMVTDIQRNHELLELVHTPQPVFPSNPQEEVTPSMLEQVFGSAVPAQRVLSFLDAKSALGLMSTGVKINLALVQWGSIGNPVGGPKEPPGDLPPLEQEEQEEINRLIEK